MNGKDEESNSYPSVSTRHQLPHLPICHRIKWNSNSTSRFIGTRLGYRYQEVPLDVVAALMKIPSLETRRIMSDILFLWRLVTADIDCPDLLQRISLRVPTCGTRSQNLFVTTSVRTNYMRNSSIIRVQRHGSSVSEDLDFFHPSSISSFRYRLQSLFN
ncbi:hypothetical protein J6590_066774 [Homalodisca vitripennis]|nr:hypothetical protein J6590_066774 [Homalodisca vitripennis]